jgi:vacuolar-type H+-ATPase subunit F/Vma7
MNAEAKDGKGQLHAVGPAEVILPFRAAGVILHPAATAPEARRALAEADGSPAGSLILVVEETAASVLPELREMETAARHAVLIVPTRLRQTGLGLRAMRAAIVRSVGVDLLAPDRAGMKKD